MFLPCLPCLLLVLALQPTDSYGGGDVVHVAHSAYVHLLRVSAVGQAAEERAPQETVKVGMLPTAAAKLQQAPVWQGS
jgi:hypothetical protein